MIRSTSLNLIVGLTSCFDFSAHNAHCQENKGKMITVIPHGVLFHSGAEGSIPAALLVINKAKPAVRKGKILFIEASSGFIKNGNKNMLRDEDIDRIVETLDGYTEHTCATRVEAAKKDAQRGVIPQDQVTSQTRYLVVDIGLYAKECRCNGYQYRYIK